MNSVLDINSEFQYEMLNQALKGLLAGLGCGTGPTRCGETVRVENEVKAGDAIVTKELLDACGKYKNGSYLIVASKIISISENRIVTVPRNPLPRRHAPKEMLDLLRRNADEGIGNISMKDAIGADLIGTGDVFLTFSLLPENPNLSAWNISQKIKESVGVCMDVVITDTSSGWKKGIDVLGVPTILTTPIGATMGVDIYYAQRLSVMAEVLRNESPLSPFVLVEPPTIRSLTREDCGKRRMDAFLTADGNEEYLRG